MLAARSTVCPAAAASSRDVKRGSEASRRSALRIARPARASLPGRTESKTNDVAPLWAVLPACLSAVTAFAARAVEAVDDYPTMYVPEGYVPSPLDDGDGVGQLVVLAFCAVCGFVGMKLSLDSEQVKSEEALAEKVAKQGAAMRAASSGPVPGTPVASLVEDAAAATTKFDNEGLLRLDAAVSPETAAALLAEVNATLAHELERASGGGGIPSDAFGNVYCKGNRYDLKLPWGGAAEKALREATGNMRPFLESVSGGEKARLCEFAALVSDPGSARQPVHPDTNYRRDRCVVTSFVALQDVNKDMGPTVFIPGSHTASAHLAFREAGETGGPALAAPHGVATLRAGDATVFDSRLLHCGGGNASDKRRVLFYFSFEVEGSENPNSAVSTIREELRGKVTLGDLLAA